MIRSVTVINAKQESLVLTLEDPSNGYAITDITGLGPTKAEINTMDNVTSDGATFNSARVGTRNIVLTIRIIGDDVETLREELTRYFPTKQNITLRFTTDNRIVYTEGYVESNDATIFSKTAGCKISVLCPYPYFKMGYGHPDTVTFSGVDAAFEFPFSNESTSDKLIEFGIVQMNSAGNLLYTGDSDVGIVITVHALGPINDVRIYNTLTHEKMIFDMTKVKTMTGTAFGAGDELVISTVKNDKYVRMLRGGVYTDVLRCLDLSSDWFTVTKGDNAFSYTVDTDINDIMLKIENDVVFEGV
jgi:hypothetical protein